MDLWDFEGHASFVYAEAGADPEDPPRMDRLARLLFGARCIRKDPKAFRPKLASYVECEGAVEIWVSRRLNARQANFPIAHEIAEWFLRRQHSEYIEHACNLMAAALVAPRRAFLPVYREVGDDLSELAETFDASESLVGLRIGEATGTPTALIAPAHIHLRGDAYGWPESERELRRLAAEPTVERGFRRISIGDARRRTLLLASP